MCVAQPTWLVGETVRFEHRQTDSRASVWGKFFFIVSFTARLSRGFNLLTCSINLQEGPTESGNPQTHRLWMSRSLFHRGFPSANTENEGVPSEQIRSLGWPGSSRGQSKWTWASRGILGNSHPVTNWLCVTLKKNPTSWLVKQMRVLSSLWRRGGGLMRLKYTFKKNFKEVQLMPASWKSSETLGWAGWAAHWQESRQEKFRTSLELCSAESQITFQPLNNWIFLFCFVYFWLPWVFVAACGLSLVAASGGHSALRCAGFSLRWLLLLQSTGSRAQTQ